MILTLGFVWIPKDLSPYALVIEIQPLIRHCFSIRTFLTQNKTYLLFSDFYCHVWIGLTIKPHIVDWILLFHAIVHMNYLNQCQV